MIVQKHLTRTFIFFTIHYSVVFCRLLLALVHLNLNVIVMI